MADPNVLTVADDNRTRALATLQMAFAADPIIRWFLPSQEAYTNHFQELCYVLTGPSFREGTAYELSDGTAAALWFAPGQEKDSDLIGETFLKFVPMETLGKMEAFGEEMRKYIPEEPYWYLSFLGVDPLAQGVGAGAILLRDRLSAIDEAGEIAYLESSNPRNISFYLRHGFEILGEVNAGNREPLTPMIRRPR